MMTVPKRNGRGGSDEGAALILTIGLMLVAATIGGSLMLLSQTETYGSYNYKLMTQARYAAESGVHKAVHHLLNGYVPPAAATVSTTFANTVSPVLYSGQPVVLSARSSVSANYPNTATQAAFNTAAHGTLTVGTTTADYAASARLMSIRAIDDYGAATATVIETWEITAEGTVNGTRPATVEVVAVLERHVIRVSMFGLFATGTNCGALVMGGGVITDSYDSTTMTMGPGGTPVTDPSGGNVGTNGNLTLNGTGTIVNGSLSTPRSGVGNCTTTSAALTLTGGSAVNEGIDQMPQPITFPTPALPNPMPPTTNLTINKNSTCASLGLAAPHCTGVDADPATGGLTLNPNGSPLLLGNLNQGSGSHVNLMPGQYHINSASLSGNSTLTTVPVGTDPVVLQVAGVGVTTPIDFTGGTVSNPSFVSSRLQIVYAGTNTLKISGGSSTAMMVYAPNADAQLVGGGSFYGSLLSNTISVSGGTAVHYDRNSPRSFGTAGNFMLSSFSWKKS
jgi:hypothetical protein